MDRDEFKFPDEQDQELEAKGKPLDDDTISIEIEDDTPPEDRNKEPMPAEKVRALESALMMPLSYSSSTSGIAQRMR